MKRFKLLLPLLILFISSAIYAQDEEVFMVVEEMPRFPGCEEVEDNDERTRCAQKKMIEYMIENIQYPKADADAKIEGMGVVSFVVDKTGPIRDIEVKRGLSEGLDEEMIRIVKNMPDWIPGKQKGVDVSVRMTLPIKFKLPQDKGKE